MNTHDRLVIVGGSIAGVRTAQALRGEGFAGRIIILSDETVMPYDKPPLSKEFLAGVVGPDQIALMTAAEVDGLGLELRLSCQAHQLHPIDKAVELVSGERVDYDQLVVASGANARPLSSPVPARVHVVRTMLDAQRLRGDLKCGRHLVVIGAGFVGAEIAATARSLGLEVTLVDTNAAPMTRIVGYRLGQQFVRLHRSHGVQTRFHTRVVGVHEDGDRLRVDLSDETALMADVCVVGIGAVPNDGWLASSGVHIDNGVVCDEFGRAGGTHDVYAVGDVARWYNPRRGRLTRHEHWTNANEQANAVAHNIVHANDLIAYAPIEYVWSDQYDWKIRIAGQISTSDISEVIGDEATDRFALLSSCDGTALSGVVVVNWPRALVACRKAMTQGTPYEEIRNSIQRLLIETPGATAVRVPR